MGLFDLPAPLFQAVDNIAGMALPDGLRLVLWGIFAGWLTMVVYRRLSNQDRITALKKEQRKQQKVISDFDGEFEELFPIIRQTLGLGFRQLGLAIGPAVLASVPVLFLVAWVAGQFGYDMPVAGDEIAVTTMPTAAVTAWEPASAGRDTETGWILTWPESETTASLTYEGQALIEFPLSHPVPIVHKKIWWNSLFGNPLGYLDDEAPVEQVDIGLSEQQFLSFGPDWLRGWMFAFFGTFLMSSLGFKFLLKID